MRIAYRRMSGMIGLTDLEQGTRGMWLEKRRALLATLAARGHEVALINRMTKYSQPVVEPKWDASYDLLMIEFGSSNTRFYGKDLAETQRMVEQHRGRVIFLCDDPDLPYLWKTIEPKRLDRWCVWANASNHESFGGLPSSVGVLDAPFASLLPQPDAPSQGGEPFVYVGRPNGREKVFRMLLDGGAQFEVGGREAEWKDFSVVVREMPLQSQRSAFYAARRGCLVVADRKHKRLGWRTGRAYHALYAGTPVLVEADHETLARSFACFGSAATVQVLDKDWMNAEARANVWREQMRLARADQDIMLATFLACDL
jgi:hypothetical protein